MSTKLHRPRVVWNANESRLPRPEIWLAALGLLALLLAEVWQNSRVTQLSLSLERTRHALAAVEAREAYVSAQLQRRSTRAVLSPLAGELGLAPADARQVVVLPADYLSSDEPSTGSSSATALAWVDRFSRALVPEATARGRNGN
jgi:multidrug efflux pump subunit AcrA (membrane-fusion protein)